MRKSTTTKNQLTCGLQAYNQTLTPAAQYNILDVDQFNKLHYGETSETGGNTVDGIVSTFKNVEMITLDGDDIVLGYKFECGEHKIRGKKEYVPNVYEVYFSGRIELNGDYANSDKGYDRGWTRKNIRGVSFKVERLVAICGCILANEMPETFEGLIVNVMDGSGNIDTAKKLGIDQDFEPENLEFTSKLDNYAHGSRILRLYKLTGHVYQFSANDKNLSSLCKTGMKRNEVKIRQYCKRNCYCVK